MRALQAASAAVVLALSAFVGTAAQAAWPDHPIEMVCATSPGSGAANWCELFAELTGKNLGQPVKVLFKGGGGGNEAAAYVAGRPADGYTWLQRNTSYAGYMNLPTFRPNPDDFVNVINVEKFLYVVAVRTDSKYKTFQDLIADMKARPGKIGVATNKPGSAHHIHMIKLFNAFGVDWNFVPYKGAGGAMKDVLGGHVPAGIGPPGIWLPHVKAGKARFLIWLDDKHSSRPELANIPTPADFGKKYDFIHQVQGMFVMKGTPKPVMERIAAAFKAATETPRYKDYLTKNPHVVPVFSGDADKNTADFTATRTEIKAFLKKAGLI
jgi:tripartite-type tricarboxylate transporter receptor subunit TctC